MVIVIATGFIPLSPLSVVSTLVMWESSQWLGKNIVIAIEAGFILSLTAVRFFDIGYVGKQPVAWKEFCAEYWLKELQEYMEMCTDRRDITEILSSNRKLPSANCFF